MATRIWVKGSSDMLVPVNFASIFPQVHIGWIPPNLYPAVYEIEQKKGRDPIPLSEFNEKIFTTYNGGLVGATCKEMVYGYLAYTCHGKYLTVRSLFVWPDYRRNGLATRFIQHLESSEIVRSVASKMRVIVPERSADLIGLMRNYGFMGRSVLREYFGRREDAFVFTKKIEVPGAPR